MRVIAGTARSLPLKAPNGDNTRPTTDRIKETLFNMIQNEVPGCVFMDLFSGSGAIGIEALSRGAKKAYFIENNKDSLQCIQENIVFTKFTEHAIVIKQDVISALAGIQEKHVDLVFMDPPYKEGYDKKVLQFLAECSFIDSDTLIIVEEAKDTDFSYVSEYGFHIRKEKIYKTNKHVFIEFNGE